MAKLIELRDVYKIYGEGLESEVRALDGVSLTIEKGEFVAIVGQSGSGKSTMMNVLGCLDVPTYGEYLLEGTDVSELSDMQLSRIRNKEIGFIFQQYNLIQSLSVQENVELPLFYNSAIGAKERRRRAEEALDAVGLHDRMMHKSNQMSGGQQQRVAIARALVNDPVLILADEATGNLDTRTSFSILTLFQQLHSMGRTIIFVTHNPELSDYSSRNIVLRDITVKNAKRVLWLKLRPDTPQHYEYVTVDNISGTTGSFLTIRPWTQFFKPGDREDMPLSQCNNITMKNIRMDCDNFFDVGKSEKYRLVDFTFENINCTDKKMAFDANLIENTIAKKVNITPREKSNRLKTAGDADGLK